eukprot:m.32021 g.32021  ORF g.32021 m.32021 type:complete len:333 (+) comp12386_c0_seq4:764-1762(+)
MTFFDFFFLGQPEDSLQDDGGHTADCHLGIAHDHVQVATARRALPGTKLGPTEDTGPVRPEHSVRRPSHRVFCNAIPRSKVPADKVVLAALACTGCGDDDPADPAAVVRPGHGHCVRPEAFQLVPADAVVQLNQQLLGGDRVPHSVDPELPDHHLDQVGVHPRVVVSRGVVREVHRNHTIGAPHHELSRFGVEREHWVGVGAPHCCRRRHGAVATQRDLARRREPPEAELVPVCERVGGCPWSRCHKRSLGQVHLGGDRLHQRDVELLGGKYHCAGVPAERHRGERVNRKDRHCLHGHGVMLQSRNLPTLKQTGHMLHLLIYSTMQWHEEPS